MSGVKYNNTAHALLTIARQERLRGLFSGLAPTLIRDAPYSGLYLLMFSNLRDMFADGSQENSMGTFVAAMIAGSVATVVTHPPDVVRTRLQLRRNMLAALGNAAHAAPLPAVRVGDIIRQEGVLALWSGIAPRVVRRTLQQAITWTLFERLLGRRIV
jgi:solute carrier family 25 protein 38